MSRSAFPSDLTYEITSADLAADWLLLQKAGERKQGKAHPSVIVPAKSDTNPVALGTAAPGTGATVSRTDHVHPTTGLLKTTDLSSSNPVALGTAGPGTGSTVSRTDHVHPTTGLLTTAALSSAGPYALGALPLSGSSSSVSRADHVHPYPTPAAIGAATSSHDHNSAYAPLSWFAGGGSSALTVLNNTSFRITNAANSEWRPLYASAVNYTSLVNMSDPAIKRNIAAPKNAPPTGKAMAEAIITFNYRSDQNGAAQRLGFSAEALEQVAPVAVIVRPADPDIAAESGLSEVRGVEITAVLALLVQQVAALEERLDQLSAVNGLVKPEPG
jgi:hypothetical protein